MLCKRALRIHMLQHDQTAKQFHCETCGKSFLTLRKLEIHRSTHLDERNHKCSYCDATFKTKNGLAIHSNIHTEAKVYECKICLKSFLHSGSLQSHKRVHTGEKPYKCDIEGCERAYMYAIDLKRHKYGAHGIWTKKHPCTVCGKIFPENKILKRHLETHN